MKVMKLRQLLSSKPQISSLVVVFIAVCVSLWIPNEYLRLASYGIPRSTRKNITQQVLLASRRYSNDPWWDEVSALSSLNNGSDTDTATKSSMLVSYEPHLLLEEYKRLHSVQALEHRINNDINDDDDDDRKYAIGLYSCPFQAGNRIFQFLNHLIWAMVTNRTLLWKYNDIRTCRRWRHSQQSACYIAKLNSERDCAKVLERASWIPSYDIYSLTFNLSQPKEINIYGTRLRPEENKKNLLASREWKECNETCTGTDNDKSQIVIFPGMLGPYGTLGLQRNREYLLYSEEARDRAKRLYSKGKDFLYGMLFRETFTITPEYTVPTTTIPHNNSNNTSRFKTYALHSRHPSSKDTGSDITKEINCLQTIWDETNSSSSSSTPCLVYIMSDRSQTIENLRKFLHSKDCSGIVANHSEGGNTSSVLEEHGPFAGGLYFMDLSLAVNARDGFVGHKRTSSELVKAVLNYDRIMDTTTRRNYAKSMPRCILSDD